MSKQQSDAGNWADEWPIIQALRDYEAKVAAEDGIWTMTDTEFKFSLARAWDEGAAAGWEASGEGWNAEYPGEPFANNEIPNPYEAKP